MKRGRAGLFGLALMDGEVITITLAIQGTAPGREIEGEETVQAAEGHSASGHSAANEVIKLAMTLISRDTNLWAPRRAEAEAELETDYGNSFLFCPWQQRGR